MISLSYSSINVLSIYATHGITVMSYKLPKPYIDTSSSFRHKTFIIYNKSLINLSINIICFVISATKMKSQPIYKLCLY